MMVVFVSRIGQNAMVDGFDHNCKEYASLSSDAMICDIISMNALVPLAL